MIWRGVWSRCNPNICSAPIREQARSHMDRINPVEAGLLAKLLEGER
jgi:hypothetical protein